MKILFLTSAGEDYLQDQLLIGFRSVLGSDLVDYPKKDIIYSNSKIAKENLYGCGFTIWKSLMDIPVDRMSVFEKLRKDEFDLVVFSSIWRQLNYFKEIIKLKLASKKLRLIFIDGEDFRKVYLPALPFGKYYKREQRPYLQRALVKEINFSIPENKILPEPLAKTKLFAKHNQCEEAYKIVEVAKTCQRKYAFSKEEDYYHDIAISKYAITMKKGGWDCMRHYDIAANLTIPCFYKLNEKPVNCAPHGLVDMVNVVSFSTADELERKLQLIEEQLLYSLLQQGVQDWILKNQCASVAQRILADHDLSKNI